MRPGEVRAAVWAGVLATFVAASAGHALPTIRLPALDLADLSGRILVPEAASIEMAWLVGLAHLFGSGIVLALLYALYVQMHLPGPGWARGMIWGGVLALFAGLTLVPLLYGGGLFGREWDGRMPITLIVGHLLWGCVLGIAYHKPRLDGAD